MATLMVRAGDGPVDQLRSLYEQPIFMPTNISNYFREALLLRGCLIA
jgi:hypothetical protein